MVNRMWMDGYTKTLNCRKIPGKTQKQQCTETLKTTKTEIQTKWGLGFCIKRNGLYSEDLPLFPRQLRHWWLQYLLQKICVVWVNTNL